MKDVDGELWSSPSDLIEGVMVLVLKNRCHLEPGIFSSLIHLLLSRNCISMTKKNSAGLKPWAEGQGRFDKARTSLMPLIPWRLAWS